MKWYTPALRINASSKQGTEEESSSVQQSWRKICKKKKIKLKKDQFQNKH